MNRRQCMLALLAGFGAPASLSAGRLEPKVRASVTRALDWLAREQKRQGYWEANQMQYRVAMTALAGNAMLCEGSTTMRGKYARNIRLAVDYLLDLAEPGGGTQPNGLIGYKNDYHYT